MNTRSYHSGHFSPFVDAFKFYQLDENDSLDLNPEGHFEFIFQLEGDFAQKAVSATEWTIRPKHFVGGLHSESFEVKALNKAKLLSVKFNPLGARHFLKDKLSAFKDELVSLEDTTRFELDLSPSDSEEQLVQQVQQFLISQHIECDKSVVDYGVECLIGSHGFVNIKNITNQLNVSSSYFRARFNEEIGMSPKAYSKILRVKYISSLLQNTDHSLTTLAHQLGYHDQAHFIKDFQSVTGETPGVYRKKRFLQL